MRRDLLSVFCGEIFYYLAEACVVHIHLRHIDHAGKIIFVTEFPCLFCSNLHSGLSGYHDNCSVRSADSLLYLTDKVKISRCVKDVDLRFLPLDGNQARADGKSSFLLLFIKIADRTGIGNFTHTACGA